MITPGPGFAAAKNVAFSAVPSAAVKSTTRIPGAFCAAQESASPTKAATGAAIAVPRRIMETSPSHDIIQNSSKNEDNSVDAHRYIKKDKPTGATQKSFKRAVAFTGF